MQSILSQSAAPTLSRALQPSQTMRTANPCSTPPRKTIARNHSPARKSMVQRDDSWNTPQVSEFVPTRLFF